MAVVVFGAALEGVDATPIEVEVDLLRRLPSIAIVGLAAGAVKEAGERVRSALSSTGLEFPRKRVVVNLAPADVRKDSAAFDLPMAIGILAADGQLPTAALERSIILGELSLNGHLRRVRGSLSLALLARRMGRQLILPECCAALAAQVPHADVVGARTLGDVVAHLRGESPLARPTIVAPPTKVKSSPDLADVRGQSLALRAVEIAAAGGHHLLMMGPPGCGKSMIAKRIPGIMPALEFHEALETTQVYSAAGLLQPHAGLLTHRPFRAPHHSVSVAGIVGDRTLRPGELSLANHGVLFLDEAVEFPRSVLEVMRGPLEDGTVRLSRARGTVEYPAAVTLVLALNPCPCGMRGTTHACVCTDTEVYRYRRRLSGPILDRIDLHVELTPGHPEDLLISPPGESSYQVRSRVTAARELQRGRGQLVPNARLSPPELVKIVEMTADATVLARAGIRTHGLSGRAATRLMKVARTIADLDASTLTRSAHIAESLAFRTTLGVVA